MDKDGTRGQGRTVIILASNDLVHDQRMARHCMALHLAGYKVQLWGRERRASKPLADMPYVQRRFRLDFESGPAFYAALNFRFLIELRRLVDPVHCITAVDMDTASAAFSFSRLRRIPMVIDLHELFSEVPELEGRRVVKHLWLRLEEELLPRIPHQITVGQALADEFARRHGVRPTVVRNVPELSGSVPLDAKPAGLKRVLYQGAMNVGRGLEAMLAVAAHPSFAGYELHLAGAGDLDGWLRAHLVAHPHLPVVWHGMLTPEALRDLTVTAYVGLNLLEGTSLSYRLSSANKFFDCVAAGVPVITMDYPEYALLNAQHRVALLVGAASADELLAALAKLAHEEGLFRTLAGNCAAARLHWQWANEVPKLLAVYDAALKNG